MMKDFGLPFVIRPSAFVIRYSTLRVNVRDAILNIEQGIMKFRPCLRPSSFGVHHSTSLMVLPGEWHHPYRRQGSRDRPCGSARWRRPQPDTRTPPRTRDASGSFPFGRLDLAKLRHLLQDRPAVSLERTPGNLPTDRLCPSPHGADLPPTLYPDPKKESRAKWSNPRGAFGRVGISDRGHPLV